ncbi:hypothetical protein A9Q02_22390 [Candidatus Chloroploca asiatica]|uniref:Sulfotransferase family protein n=2 Tax=Candidatus Chloroploca asiatica TaxID=1506545 RepID=A0A2H3KWH4_9CHLR|nr:hypothetical protein A9Q02_22390 [Candidatus Chloroploca asiatica]
MHRSGTSFLAQWLANSGLPLTTGGDIRSDVSNPRGYFEDLDFVRLHAWHLRRIRRFSAGWKLTPKNFLHFTAEETECATSLVRERSALHTAWGWKDPRTTIFLMHWKKLIPSLKVIIVWRPCADVAHSLVTRGLKQRRPHLLITPISAIHLWHTHNEFALEYAARFPEDTVVIPASQFPSIDQSLHKVLTEQFGLQLEAVPMADLFHPKMLAQAPAWLHWLSSALGADEIEARLMAASLHT